MLNRVSLIELLGEKNLTKSWLKNAGFYAL